MEEVEQEKVEWEMDEEKGGGVEHEMEEESRRRGRKGEVEGEEEG